MAPLFLKTAGFPSSSHSDILCYSASWSKLPLSGGILICEMCTCLANIISLVSLFFLCDCFLFFFFPLNLLTWFLVFCRVLNLLRCLTQIVSLKSSWLIVSILLYWSYLALIPLWLFWCSFGFHCAVPRGVIYGCGDLIFSSHMIFTLVFVLTYQRYGTRR